MVLGATISAAFCVDDWPCFLVVMVPPWQDKALGRIGGSQGQLVQLARAETKLIKAPGLTDREMEVLQRFPLSRLCPIYRLSGGAAINQPRFLRIKIFQP